MSPAGFELAVTAGERPQNYALERAGTGMCYHITGQKSQDIYLLTFIRKYVKCIGYNVARNTGGCSSVRSDICHSFVFHRIKSYNFSNP
jgi:hypothetical protein